MGASLSTACACCSEGRNGQGAPNILVHPPPDEEEVNKMNTKSKLAVLKGRARSKETTMGDEEVRVQPASPRETAGTASAEVAVAKDADVPDGGESPQSRGRDSGFATWYSQFGKKQNAPPSAEGAKFKEAAREHAVENRIMVDSIKLFQRLPEEEKDQIATALRHSVYTAGQTVLTEGEKCGGIYFVKSGSVKYGEGVTLEAGESFGERTLLNEDAVNPMVVATTDCEIVRISADKLEKLLGMDIRRCLDRNAIIAAMNRSAIFGHLKMIQQDMILQVMDIRQLDANSTDSTDAVFVTVIEGQITMARPGGSESYLQGDFFEYSWDGSDQASGDIATASASARVGIFAKDAVIQALDKIGVSGIEDRKRGLELLKKMALMNKVRIFRHLSAQQMGNFVKTLKLRTFKSGEKVAIQGETGTMFFIVESGQVKLLVDGMQIRELSKHDFLGERALVVSEPSFATCEIGKEGASLWCCEKSEVESFMPVAVRNELVGRIALSHTAVELMDLKHVQIIGKGEFGIVRLVESVISDATYALRRIPDEHRQSGAGLHEYNLLKEIDHPFILHMVKTLETSKSVYVLSEIIMGGSLRHALDKHRRPLTPTQAQFYVGCLVLALETLSEHNICYRDLTPENVLLDLEGFPKLIDFNNAKKFRTRRSRTFTLLGEIHYTAPEAMRSRGYGIEIDLWSLGVMVFEILTCRTPFGSESDDPSKTYAAIQSGEYRFPETVKDDPAKRLVSGLLQVDPSKRLGAGVTGFADMKNEEFFKVENGASPSLFERLITRVMVAPILPDGKTFEEPEGAADLVLSDADELAD